MALNSKILKIHPLCFPQPWVFFPSFSGSLSCSFWSILKLGSKAPSLLPDPTKVSYLALGKQKSEFMLESNQSWHTQLLIYNTLPRPQYFSSSLLVPIGQVDLKFIFENTKVLHIPHLLFDIHPPHCSITGENDLYRLHHLAPCPVTGLD